jgi:hypothetical protein
LLFVDEADAFLRKRSKVCSDILSVFNQSCTLPIKLNIEIDSLDYNIVYTENATVYTEKKQQICMAFSNIWPLLTWCHSLSVSVTFSHFSFQEKMIIQVHFVFNHFFSPSEKIFFSIFIIFKFQ